MLELSPAASGHKKGGHKAAWFLAQIRLSGDGHLPRKIDILDCIENLDTFLQRPLESLAPGDQTHATSALVDHGSPHRFSHIVFAGCTAGVDQSRAPHV